MSEGWANLHSHEVGECLLRDGDVEDAVAGGHGDIKEELDKVGEHERIAAGECERKRRDDGD